MDGFASTGPSRAKTSGADRLGVSESPECEKGRYVASPGAGANAQPMMSALMADVSWEIAAMPIAVAASRARASVSTSSIDAATWYLRVLVAAVGAYSVTSVRKPSAENNLKQRSGDGPLNRNAS